MQCRHQELYLPAAGPFLGTVDAMAPVRHIVIDTVGYLAAATALAVGFADTAPAQAALGAAAVMAAVTSLTVAVQMYRPRRCHPAPSWLQEATDTFATNLNLRSRPVVRVSARPIPTVGIVVRRPYRPLILVDSSLAYTAAPSVAAAVCAHEVGHLRRQPVGGGTARQIVRLTFLAGAAAAVAATSVWAVPAAAALLAAGMYLLPKRTFEELREEEFSADAAAVEAGGLFVLEGLHVDLGRRVPDRIPDPDATHPPPNERVAALPPTGRLDGRLVLQVAVAGPVEWTRAFDGDHRFAPPWNAMPLHADLSDPATLEGLAAVWASWMAGHYGTKCLLQCVAVVSARQWRNDGTGNLPAGAFIAEVAAAADVLVVVVDDDDCPPPMIPGAVVAPFSGDVTGDVTAALLSYGIDAETRTVTGRAQLVLAGRPLTLDRSLSRLAAVAD